METRYVIELDLYGDEPIEWAATYGCSARKISQFDVYVISGTFGQVAALMHEYFVEQAGADLTELLEHMAMIQKVTVV